MSCGADPTFTKSILISYNFELVQQMKVSVYDADDVHTDVNALNLNRQDALGSATFRVADAAKDLSGALMCTLQGGAASGIVLIAAEEAVNYRQALEVTFSAASLTNMDGRDPSPCQDMLCKRRV